MKSYHILKTVVWINALIAGIQVLENVLRKLIKILTNVKTAIIECIQRQDIRIQPALRYKHGIPHLL